MRRWVKRLRLERDLTAHQANLLLAAASARDDWRATGAR